MQPSSLTFALLAILPFSTHAATLTGRVVDSGSQAPIACRIYIRSEAGEWFFPKSVGGSAVSYKKQARDRSVEMHTTLSADPFRIELSPGTYDVTIERGKEYFPLEQRVEVGTRDVELTLELKRWTNMAARGWYSGDTHNHRMISDLPNIMLAEDLNVGLPLTAWVTDSEHTPLDEIRKPQPPQARLIEIDPTHVIWPVNTEYEIFTVRQRRHTLGALFVLNHHKQLDLAAPPVGPIARHVRSQSPRAILDMDKHNWPWSMMLPDATGVELFELTNNHLWRTQFAFGTWYTEYAGEWMQCEQDPDGGLTERGWMDYGFKNYYALLNCGFPMQPSAGTASGVHPVPLGFGRVYVQLEEGFLYDQWIEGLRQGRSFVTTGPMLTAKFNGRSHGTSFQADALAKLHIEGQVESAGRLSSLEVIVNGEVAMSLPLTNEQLPNGGRLSRFKETLEIDKTSWIALRCFEQAAGGRVRFAHTSPVHVTIPGQPLRPPREQVEYLIQRVEDEIQRHRGVLPEEAMEEYARARKRFQSLLD